MLDNESPPHKSVQKFFEKVGPIFDSLSKNERKSMGESKSENISTVSRSDKSIPLYARTINTNLFNKLTEHSKFSFKFQMEDRSLCFFKLIRLFRESNLFNDSTDPAML